MTATRETWINGRWALQLPEHRAARPEWPYWEAARLAAMRTVIGPGEIVWDVGAEEGDFPALWASWGAHVVMAEPNPLVWPNIKLIWEANDLPEPMLCWPGFLGAEPAPALPDLGQLLYRWPASADGPVISDHGFCRPEERPDLPATTVDQLVDAGVTPPSILTLDVEGSEFAVLSGAHATIAEHRPHVFVSVHQEFARHHYGHEDVGAMISGFFDALGYDEQFLTHDHERHVWFRP